MYKLSIGAACALEWPTERFVIQVLDDSTDPVVKVRTYAAPAAAGDLTGRSVPSLGPSPSDLFCDDDLRGHATEKNPTNHSSIWDDGHVKRHTRVSSLRAFLAPTCASFL